MVSHVLLQILIFPILKKLSTHMPDLLRIILLRCLAPCSMGQLLTKLVLCTVLLLGRFNSSSNSNSNNNNNDNSNNSNSNRKVVHLPLCCFLVRHINIKDKVIAKTICSKHYPHPLFTVTIHNIIKTLPLPHRHHPNLQVLLHLIPTIPSLGQALYSYANLSDAPNRIATRVINKLMA
jgi:hypothetical protein